MVPILIAAVPFFLLLLVAEMALYRRADHDDDLIGYEPNDTRTSILGGLGHVIVNLGWKAAITAIYAGLYTLTPLRLDTGDWWFWVLLFFADDLSYYWYHRISHESRIFWASHVVHHSSEHYNLSTALRQPWLTFQYLPFWAWMPLAGFPVWTVLLAQSWNLIYQFWIHTERITKMPRWFEAIFNTPSHHRVHHGSQLQYLDRNYAGILIIWDRMFGTFEPEGERVRYGLTKNLGTFNLLKVQFHEYGAIWHDVRRATNLRDRLSVVFKGPGWRPAEPAGLSEQTGAVTANHPDQGPLIEGVRHAAQRVRHR